MKTLKRISALLLALLLAASFSITAFAEEPLDTSFDPYSGAGIDGDGGNGGGNNNNNNNNNTGGGDAGDPAPTTSPVYASANQQLTVGTVTVDNHNEAVLAMPGSALDPELGASVNVIGDVNLEFNRGNPTAVTARADDANATVKVTGSVSVTNTGTDTGANAVFSWAENGNTATVNVGGNVTASGNDATGIVAKAESGSTATVTVGTIDDQGNVTGGIGISAVSKTGGTTNITAGDITADNRAGIYAAALGSDGNGKISSVTVETGDITNTHKYGTAVYVDAGTYGPEELPGNVTVKVGDIDAKNDALQVNAFRGGVADITADNISGSTGIAVRADSNTNSSVNITVGTADEDGEVTGGIDLSGVVNKDNVSVTVWKVDAVNGSACDAAINYIVRIAEESKGNITADGDKVKTDEETGLTTANVGGKIYVQPKSGYKVASAKNNDTPLESDKNGFYYDFQSHGGGIMLSAILEKLPDPQPDPPKPVGPVAVFSYKLSFDLDGGVMPDGKTELEMKCSAGQWINLPEAPEKEGSTFAGWQTEVRGKPVVYTAGARYKVSVGKTFTALWIEDQA